MEPSSHDVFVDDILPLFKRVLDQLDKFDNVPFVKESRIKIKFLQDLLVDKRRPRFALIGRRGCGKSSFINALLNSYQVKLGHFEAQTGAARWHQIDNIDVLDTRGCQEGSSPIEKDQEKTAEASVKRAFDDGKLPDVIFFLVKAVDVDSAIGNDLEFLQKITLYVNSIRASINLGPVPVIALLTQCDQMYPAPMTNWDLIFPKTVRINDDEEDLELAKEKSKNIKGAVEKLQQNISVFNSKQGKDKKIILLQDPIPIAANSIYVRQIIGAPPSKKHSVIYNIDVVQNLILNNIPSSGTYYLVSSIAVEQIKCKFARVLVTTFAFICGSLAGMPIPLSDIVPITATQYAMVSCIRGLAPVEHRNKTIVEMISAAGVTTGVGFIAREVFRQLLKLLPGVGSMVGAITAWAVTMALGEVAISFFLKGQIVKFSEMLEKFKKEKSPFL